MLRQATQTCEQEAHNWLAEHSCVALQATGRQCSAEMLSTTWLRTTGTEDVSGDQEGGRGWAGLCSGSAAAPQRCSRQHNRAAGRCRRGHFSLAHNSEWPRSRPGSTRSPRCVSANCPACLQKLRMRTAAVADSAGRVRRTRDSPRAACVTLHSACMRWPAPRAPCAAHARCSVRTCAAIARCPVRTVLPHYYQNTATAGAANARVPRSNSMHGSVRCSRRGAGARRRARAGPRLPRAHRRWRAPALPQAAQPRRLQPPAPPTVTQPRVVHMRLRCCARPPARPACGCARARASFCQFDRREPCTLA